MLLLNIGTTLKLTAVTTIENTDTVTITIYDESCTKIVDGAAMTQDTTTSWSYNLVTTGYSAGVYTVEVTGTEGIYPSIENDKFKLKAVC